MVTRIDGGMSGVEGGMNGLYVWLEGEMNGTGIDARISGLDGMVIDGGR